MCIFTASWAATSVAAKSARVPHGRKATCVHGWLACAFVKLRFTRLRSTNPFFRDLLMTLDRLRRYSLSLAFYAENAALALRAPSMPHYHAAGGRRSMLATLAPPAVKDNFNTILQHSPAKECLTRRRSR